MKTNLLILFLYMQSMYCLSASFDCSKAATHIEKMICTDQTLSDLDEVLSHTYNLALSSHNAKGLITYQRSWLNEQRNLCDHQKCLKTEYKRRIAQLNYLIKSKPQHIFNAHYSKQHKIGAVEKSGPEHVSVVNTLDIEQQKDASLTFAYTSINSNYHTCYVYGNAKKNKTNDTFIFKSIDKENKELCTIHIYLNNNSIVVHDINNNCQNSYCGMRGIIGKDIFLLNSGIPRFEPIENLNF
ncbi:lysozyme inhibitor LprI family protein [Zooshikella harenae]|uniref:DUF1311 domain-containing protein n=1 Tax=Zooshikella harenae TaxID=2827238 RepID=A0ABS5ZAM5_9GAMM|nr:lysozyme inhibitor LprI family protein [Zooshikella harenae]MBU2710938.1 DUF1311 domain-containing protein [Zooshikella harenae]